MSQLNQLLGEVKDLLRQQVTSWVEHKKSPITGTLSVGADRAAGLQRQGRAWSQTSGGPVQPAALGLCWKGSENGPSGDKHTRAPGRMGATQGCVNIPLGSV